MGLELEFGLALTLALGFVMLGLELSSSLFAPASEVTGDPSSLSKLNPNELFPRLKREFSELSELSPFVRALELELRFPDGLLEAC